MAASMNSGYLRTMRAPTIGDSCSSLEAWCFSISLLVQSFRLCRPIRYTLSQVTSSMMLYMLDGRCPHSQMM